MKFDDTFANAARASKMASLVTAGVRRYTQADPLTRTPRPFARSKVTRRENEYAYVLGNPVRNIDPLGLETNTVCVANWTLLGGSLGLMAGAAAGAASGAAVSVGVLTIPGGLLGAIGGAIGGAVIGNIFGHQICTEVKSCPKPIDPPKKVKCHLVDDYVDFTSKMRVCVYNCPPPAKPVVVVHPDYHTPCAPTYEAM